MLSFPVKFDLHHRPAPDPRIPRSMRVPCEHRESTDLSSLSPDTLTLLHHLAPSHWLRPSPATHRSPLPLFQATDGGPRITGPVSLLQSILTKSRFANPFRMNSYAKHPGGDSFTSHHSRVKPVSPACFELAEELKKKDHSLLPRFSLLRRHYVPTSSNSFHSFSTLNPISRLSATLTKTPGGGPPPSPPHVHYTADRCSQPSPETSPHPRHLMPVSKTRYTVPPAWDQNKKEILND